jgi:hypothetical protein
MSIFSIPESGGRYDDSTQPVDSQERRRRRSLFGRVALLAGAVALSVSGCGLFGSSAPQASAGSKLNASRTPQATTQPKPQGDPFVPASVATRAVWGKDGCLEYLATDSKKRTVAASSTDLCRTAITYFPHSFLAGPGTYYAYFINGDDYTQWQMMEGTGKDGEIYTDYSNDDNLLTRAPVTGGETQLAVRYPDNTAGFVTLQYYFENNPTYITIQEAAGRNSIAATVMDEAVGLPAQRDPRLPAAGNGEYQQALGEIAVLDQQAIQLGQVYSNLAQDRNLSAFQELTMAEPTDSAASKLLLS